MDWNAASGTVGAHKERCRLVSYAAIIHGSTLLPHVPKITRAILANFEDPSAQISEELLRTLGNVARYTLAAHADGAPLPPDVLSTLLSPLLGGAAAHTADGFAARSRTCFLAIHRVTTDRPHNRAAVS